MGKDELCSQTELSANSGLLIIKDTDLVFYLIYLILILFNPSQCQLDYLFSKIIIIYL